MRNFLLDLSKKRVYYIKKKRAGSLHAKVYKSIIRKKATEVLWTTARAERGWVVCGWMWRPAQVELRRGLREVSLTLFSPTEGFLECPQVDDAARFVRGAGSCVFKSGKHPHSLLSSARAAHPRMTRPTPATSWTAWWCLPPWDPCDTGGRREVCLRCERVRVSVYVCDTTHGLQSHSDTDHRRGTETGAWDLEDQHLFLQNGRHKTPTMTRIVRN